MAQDQTTVVRTADEDSISETVVFAVADARGVCPTELETPLYAAIDTDALDGLLSGSNRNKNLDTVRIEFTWAGCEVVVHGTGRIIVTKPVAKAGESHLLAT